MLTRLVEEFPRFLGYYNMVFLLKAAWITLALSAVGCFLGLTIGFFIAMVRVTRGKLLVPARVISVSYVEFFRRIPFLVTLMIVFFFYQALGQNVTVFTVALTAVSLIATSYTAEIARSGLESVNVKQWEAAETMNFSLIQTLWWVILPQAWKVILPPAFSFFILFIKDTALASQIGVVELTYAGKILNNKGFSAILVFGSVLLLYFIISYPLARFGAWMEKTLGVSKTGKR
jgi:polar amino acid transport system permease protein